jgi:hypothetical protein
MTNPTDNDTACWDRLGKAEVIAGDAGDDR